MKVVFYHWSPNLFDQYDPPNMRKSELKQLWCRTSIREGHFPAETEAVDYSFSVEDPQLLKLHSDLSESEHARLLAAATRDGNTAMKEKLVENGLAFRLAEHADNIAPADIKTLVHAGFDGTAGAYVCLFNQEKVGSFLPQGLYGPHAAAFKDRLQKLAEAYPEPGKTLEEKVLPHPEGEKLLSLRTRIYSALDKIGIITESSDSVAELKNAFSRLCLQALDPAEEHKINPTQLFIAPIVQTCGAHGRYFDLQEGHRDQLLPDGYEHLRHRLPQEGSGGALMAQIREDLTAVIKTTSLMRHNIATPAVSLDASPSISSAFVDSANITPSPAIARCSIDNLFPDENGTASGIAFPDNADEALFQKAEKLVDALNALHQERDIASTSMLRDCIAKNTQRLASEPERLHYRHDEQKGDLSHYGYVRDHVNGAEYIQTQIKMLELSSSPQGQAAGAALRDFMQSYADTAGASPYARLALQTEKIDVEAIVKKLSAAPAPSGQRQDFQAHY